MIELPFLKKLMSIKQVHQKNVIFVTIAISWIIVLNFNQMSVIDVFINLLQNTDLTEKSGTL